MGTVDEESEFYNKSNWLCTKMLKIINFERHWPSNAAARHPLGLWRDTR